jgi:hypothetical protein
VVIGGSFTIPSLIHICGCASKTYALFTYTISPLQIAWDRGALLTAIGPHGLLTPLELPLKQPTLEPLHVHLVFLRLWQRSRRMLQCAATHREASRPFQAGQPPTYITHDLSYHCGGLANSSFDADPGNGPSSLPYHRSWN